MDMYAEGLAAVHDDQVWSLAFDDGQRIPLDVARWCADTVPGDASLLARCVGPTLDIGCGPGRLTAALRADGLRSLGVDISPAAVRLAHDRGAPAVLRSVFEPLPDEGGWAHVLLADGNVGIGGEPERLLRRCTELLRADGTVVLELDPPDRPVFRGTVRIESPLGRSSAAFPWARIPVSEAAALGIDSGLRLLDTWTAAGRWFCTLGR